jgi:hypothetical protein
MRGAEMSAGLATMTTTELLQRFVDTAKRTGTIFGPDKEKLRQTPNRKALVEEMQALGAELRNRKPIEELRGLFEDGDPDVRGWAGPQFLSIDPDWATATFTGLCQNLSTRDVLAWRDRILRGAPKRPKLGEMTISQLLDRFVDACERCYGSTRFLTDEQGGGPDMRAYNKVSGEPYAVATELDRRGRLRELTPLLDHSFVTVRQKAARYCLPIAADKALAVLKAIDTKSLSKESMEASWTLSEWQRGKYRTFPYD